MPPPLRPGAEHGPYELLEELGRGAFGVVYRARDRRDGRPVALKVLTSVAGSGAERFAREAAGLARLRHPGVVGLLDAGVARGFPYLAMELVEGGSLEDLERFGASPTRAAQLIRDVALALAHAHAQGVLHRDVKPANILLDALGRPRLADFGLARLVERDSSLTVSGAMLGTPAFSAPEQLRGDRGAVDARSDVYALGATLYSLLTGRPPHLKESYDATLRAVLEDDPLPPSACMPGVPPALDAICVRCLAKAPAERYPSAEAMAEALSDWLGSDGAPPTPGRRAPLVAGSVCLGVLCAGLGWILLQPPAAGVAGDRVATPEPLPAQPEPPPPEPSRPEPDPPEPDPPEPDPPHPPQPEPDPPEPDPGAPTDPSLLLLPDGVGRVHVAGPWVVLVGNRNGVLPRVPDGSEPIWLDFELHADPVWIEAEQLLLLPGPAGVKSWSPTEGLGTWVADLASLLTLSSGQVLGAVDRSLVVWTVDGQEQLRVGLQDPLSAPPLGFDHDADGALDSALVCTTACDLVLVDLRGRTAERAVLPSPVRAQPSLLPNGEVLLCAQEGQLARMRVGRGELTQLHGFQLTRSLTADPLLVRDDVLLAACQHGWLLALAPDLSRVEWADQRPGWEACELVAADVDGDGTAEAVSIWLKMGRDPTSLLVVYTPDGSPQLEVPLPRPTRLARADGLPLWTAGGALRAWGPWRELPPPGDPRGVDDPMIQLAGGAHARAARLIASSGPADPASDLLLALAEAHLGLPARLQGLVETEGRERLAQRAVELAEPWRSPTTDPASVANYLDPLSARLPSRPLAPTRLPWEPWTPEADSYPALSPAATHALELRTDSPLARGSWGVISTKGATLRPDRESTGLLIGQGGGLQVMFELETPGERTLHLRHRALNHHMMGYASIRLVVNGRAERTYLAPQGAYTSVIALGDLEASSHTVRLEVLPGAQTFYSVVRLEIE
jgi:Protein kinase domain